MTGRFRFHADEHARVDEAHEAVATAARSAGLALPDRGAIHAGFNRWLVHRTRSATGRRPRHGEVAARLLEWSRDRGRIELFALCPAAHALCESHGEEGLALAARHCPALAEAHGLREASVSDGDERAS